MRVTDTRQNRNGRISLGSPKRVTFRTREKVEETANRLARQAESTGNTKRARQIRNIANRWTSSSEVTGSRPYLAIGGITTREGTYPTSQMTNAMRATNEDKRAAQAAKGSSNG